MKNKLDWRFRKGSEADPIKSLECGCKYYVYDKAKTIIRHCETHLQEHKKTLEGTIYESKTTPGKCMKCGKKEDLRSGLCFDCAGNTTESEWKELNARRTNAN